MELNVNSKCTENVRNKSSGNLTKKIVQCASFFLMVACSILSIFTDLQFFTWVWYALQVFLLWIAADFITGIIHWWEDTYGNPDWPIIGKYVVEPNLVHHKQPTKLLEGSYWNRIDTSFFAVVLLGAVLWFLGLHSWQMIVCLFFV